MKAEVLNLGITVNVCQNYAGEPSFALWDAYNIPHLHPLDISTTTTQT